MSTSAFLLISQGNVYIKFLNADGAAIALKNLNGRTFMGKQIIAEFLPEILYLQKCPDSVTANTVLAVDAS